MVIGLKTAFTLKILFLKHDGQFLFINFRAKAAQLSTLIRPIHISKKEFQNIRLFSQEQANQLTVPYQPLL